MIRPFSFLILAAIFVTGCQNQKNVSDKTEVKRDTSTLIPLETQLQAIDTNFSTDSVLLSFSVFNHSDTVQRFCKWETPFEPMLGKYMEIVDEQGIETQFTGPMARRVMPPPAESYILVQPHDCVSTVYNLAKNYTIKPGKYTVKYTGGGVSGLQEGNEVKITVNGK
ncbi:protease [Sphingobacterium faecium]|uniref:protease n=2 Tax=Sphingobacterium TaxID=28453 RepID=UPI00320950AD